jgi:flagellar assembly protein FliH
VQKSCAEARIEVYEYPACPDEPPGPEWNAWTESVEAGGAEGGNRQQPGASGAGAGREEFNQRLAEEGRKCFEAGRERGRQEGGQAESQAQAAAQGSARERQSQQMAGLVLRFREERDQYMSAVEPEVVRLALAVAARILRREAQMDPLLLTGAVRVALGQLSASTEVKLRVPAAELELWIEAIRLLPNLARQPAVVAGDGMRLGDCVVETSLGSVDLGLRSQLGEIERGFFDRAGRQELAIEAHEAPGTTRESRS